MHPENPASALTCRAIVLACTALATLVFATGGNAAPKLKVLHSFCSEAACADGRSPFAGVTIDQAGTLYGASFYDGDHDYGVVFSLKPKFKKLHSFCANGGPSCTDGARPYSHPIVDLAGNLYGTAILGGAGGVGVVYKLAPNGKYKILYNFCSQAACADGSTPNAALTYQGASSGAPYDGVSPLYGTAQYGGGPNDAGVAYQLTPVAGKSKWKQKVLYSFCSVANCSDGSYPQSALLVDASGALYGVTPSGGDSPSSYGVVFQLKVKNGKWAETVLHDFCDDGICDDGLIPYATPVMDASGDLYGTASQGGEFGYGTVFKLTPNGTNSPYEVIYSFCQEQDCNDGAYPQGPLALGSSGALFGTTSTLGNGNVYKLSEQNGVWTETTVYTFCTVANCADGKGPKAGVVLDASQNLFGTTESGGQFGVGGVFRLTP